MKVTANITKEDLYLQQENIEDYVGSINDTITALSEKTQVFSKTLSVFHEHCVVFERLGIGRGTIGYFDVNLKSLKTLHNNMAAFDDCCDMDFNVSHADKANFEYLRQMVSCMINEINRHPAKTPINDIGVNLSGIGFLYNSAPASADRIGIQFDRFMEDVEQGKSDAEYDLTQSKKMLKSVEAIASVMESITQSNEYNDQNPEECMSEINVDINKSQCEKIKKHYNQIDLMSRCPRISEYLSTVWNDDLSNLLKSAKKISNQYENNKSNGR